MKKRMLVCYSCRIEQLCELAKICIALSAGTVEYTDCFSAEE